VCECGNIPVVRKLMQKGFGVSQSITFLLAAPIVNPVVWITTAEAFNLDRNIAWLRLGLGLVIAVSIGLLFSLKKDPAKSWLTPNFATSCEHHSHNHDSHNHALSHTHPHNHQSKMDRAFQIFHLEAFEVTKMLLFGALLAASIQSFIPRQSIIAIGQNPVLSVICMLFLAFVVSMCSNVDAFFALSLSSTFTLGAIMTFLVFGPMIDIKVLAMIRQTFKPSFIFQLVLIVALFSLIAGFGTNVFYTQYYLN
jgi:uncharacterized protein